MPSAESARVTSRSSIRTGSPTTAPVAVSIVAWYRYLAPVRTV
jgi:hypothetical protein